MVQREVVVLASAAADEEDHFGMGHAVAGHVVTAGDDVDLAIANQNSHLGALDLDLEDLGLEDLELEDQLSMGFEDCTQLEDLGLVAVLGEGHCSHLTEDRMHHGNHLDHPGFRLDLHEEDRHLAEVVGADEAVRNRIEDFVDCNSKEAGREEEVEVGSCK